MSVKTITIDIEAYNLLSSIKAKGDSFSKVIKKRLRPGNTAESLLKRLSACELSGEAADAVDGVIHSRADSLLEFRE